MNGLHVAPSETALESGGYAIANLTEGIMAGTVQQRGGDLGFERRATLDQVKERLPPLLGPVYEKPFSMYGDYRPWRAGLLGNIERTYAMVS